MTNNGLYIQTISIKRTDFQADRVLPFGQVTEGKVKADPLHFLKFILANPHCPHLALPLPQTNTSQSQKSTIFSNAQMKTIL